jgi:carboxypeptidase C (cathepsin A)
MYFVTLILSTLLLNVLSYTDEALKDQVVNLHGTEGLNVTFDQFSGYITLPDGNKNVHYWLQNIKGNDYTKAPLVFWTNGGPGCSGVLGAMTEQGAFRPTKDLKLSLNDFSWNGVANMVFIESPVGVGYSYSDNDDDYTMGDAQTAQDNYDLIQGFLKKFPELASNDLYITSESYGGHYLPTWAKKIVDENTAGKNPKLNFKGFAVGNPYTNVYTGTASGLVTYWGHQIVAKPTWDKFEENCIDVKVPKLQKCEELMIEMYRQVGNLNPYALDYPVCVSDEGKKLQSRQAKFFKDFLHKDSAAELRKAIGLSSTPSVTGMPEYDPCVDDYTIDYMNLDDVKTQLHVKSDIKWSECSYKIRYSQKDSRDDMTGYYNYLIDGGYDLNILVYSGDDDSVCSTEGTQSWIWDLGYKSIKQIWRSYSLNDQQAGYWTQFEGKLTFLTVRNAGHEVPTYQPEVALDLFTKYLKGEWFQ